MRKSFCVCVSVRRCKRVFERRSPGRVIQSTSERQSADEFTLYSLELSSVQLKQAKHKTAPMHFISAHAAERRILIDARSRLLPFASSNHFRHFCHPKKWNNSRTYNLSTITMTQYLTNNEEWMKCFWYRRNVCLAMRERFNYCEIITLWTMLERWL